MYSVSSRSFCSWTSTPVPKRETFPKASWTALSSKHTSSSKNLSEATLILYSTCSDRYRYPAAPPWRQSGTQGWAMKPECPTSPQKASPVPSKGAVSQLSGSATTRNLSSQPRYCFSNNFLQEGFLSRLGKADCLAQGSQLISVQSRINGSVHVHGFWMKVTHVLPFPRQTVRNLWNRDPINRGFEPTASCRCCIRDTQFYTASLQKHCKSCKKSGPRNQPSSADTVKPVKERSSPCGILRGKSSTQGNHCQCWKK